MALYKNDRTVDIMYRYLSGDTLRQIGDAYGLTGERIRQICFKSMSQMLRHLTQYTKDVVERDKDTSL